MKKFILIIISLTFFCGIGRAQYYNPYNNPYANQQAFEMGRRMAEQAQQQQEAQLRNNPILMAGAMVQAIANGQDEKGYNYAEYLAEHRSLASDWYWLGLLNEAGIYNYDIDYAKTCYKFGARLTNGRMCMQRLDELNAGNEVTEDMVRNHCRQIVYYGSQVTLPDFGSGSSSSSTRSSSSCPKCHGSGIDPSPIAVGDLYMGANIASQGLVGYTHTNGSRCPHCGKYEYHVHYKCYSSTYHPNR